MAVKKKNEVEVTPKTTKAKAEPKEEPVVETPVDEPVVIEEVEEIVEEPVVEPKKKVEIDTTPVDKSNSKENVRIKMRENHKCWIGGECYCLMKGQCYNVPKEVKMRLSKAGLLLPL